ncbi:MAG TPA: hypothetical protein VK698_28170 [Kofleriaceae bacterium]|nr:hypothetical protein [Kofleriaceae bacterium]
MRTRTLLVGAVAGWVGSVGVAHAGDPPAGDPPASDSLPGESADEISDLDKLRAPDSPAFLLLGVSPVEIQRPTTPKELSVALGSFVSSGSLVVPDSLSVEIAPYWLFWHPALTGDDMATSSPGEAAVRNFTVSLGTTTRSLGQPDGMGGTIDASVTDLALGLRTRWLDGRRRAACWADVDQAAQAIAARQGREMAARMVEITASYHLESRPDGLPEAERKRLQAELEQVRKQKAPALVELEEVAARCVEASAARRGLVGDVAVAGSLRFPGGQLDDGDWLAAGGWITLSAQGESHNLIALARALADNASGEASLVADLGLRYVLVHGRYALSTEGIYRRLGADVDDQDLFRVDVAVDMRLYGTVWFTATFARDFAAADAGEVFALANVKWGFGGPTVQLPGE